MADHSWFPCCPCVTGTMDVVVFHANNGSNQVQRFTAEHGVMWSWQPPSAVSIYSALVSPKYCALLSLDEWPRFIQRIDTETGIGAGKITFTESVSPKEFGMDSSYRIFGVGAGYDHWDGKAAWLEARDETDHLLYQLYPERPTDDESNGELYGVDCAPDRFVTIGAYANDGTTNLEGEVRSWESATGTLQWTYPLWGGGQDGALIRLDEFGNCYFIAAIPSDHQNKVRKLRPDGTEDPSFTPFPAAIHPPTPDGNNGIYHLTDTGGGYYVVRKHTYLGNGVWTSPSQQHWPTYAGIGVSRGGTVYCSSYCDDDWDEACFTKVSNDGQSQLWQEDVGARLDFLRCLPGYPGCFRPPTRRKRVSRPPEARTEPCRHLGGQVRSVLVRTCRGRRVGHAICECDLHGECTPVRPEVAGVWRCWDCLDYQADMENQASIG